MWYEIEQLHNKCQHITKLLFHCLHPRKFVTCWPWIAIRTERALESRRTCYILRHYTLQ